MLETDLTLSAHERTNVSIPSAKTVPSLVRDRRARVAAFLFYSVIALAPLPFGSIDPVMVSCWCVVLAVALSLVSDAPLVPFQRVVLSLLGMTALVIGGTVYLQLAEPPLIAPSPVWQRAANALGSELAPVTAMAKNLPFFAVGNLIACGLALAVGVVLGASARRVRQGLDVFALSCGLYAVYGIFSAVTEPTMILWTRRNAYDGGVIGTFIYRNTAAVYFASGAAIATLLLLRRIMRAIPSQRRTLKRVLDHVSSKFDARLLGYFGAASACLAAVLLSGSRAGFILLLGSMAIVFAGEAHRLRNLKPPVAWGLVALAVFLALRLSAPSLDARFTGSGLDDEGRFAVQAATLNLVLARPWIGVGAGLFPLAFQTVRPVPPDIWGTYVRAFNVPLETAAEFGVPIAVLLCLLFLAAGLVVWRAGPRASKLLRGSGLVLLLISGAHALVDYSLEVPGFAIVVSALLGLILAGLVGDRRDAAPRQAASAETVLSSERGSKSGPAAVG